MALTDKKMTFESAAHSGPSVNRGGSSWLHSKWVRFALVAGVLLAAILLAWLGTRIDPLYVAVLGVVPLSMVGFFYLLQHDQLFPLIILLAALFIPFSLPTGTGSRLVISFLLAIVFSGGWILKMLTVNKKIHLRPFPVNPPLLAFMAVTLFSIVWSILFRDPFVFVPGRFTVIQIASGVMIVMLPAVFLMVGNLVADLRIIRLMVGMMLAAGVAGLVSEVVGLGLPVNTGGMFSLWVVALAYSLALYDRRLNAYLRGGLLLLAAGWMVWNMGLHISWVAGWLPPLVAMGILSFLKSRKLALLFVIFLVVFLVVQRDYVQGVFLAERAESGYSRLDAWRMNWTVTGEHWLFGTGPAGYTVYYMSYFPTNAMATHSNYIDILAQMGVVGLGLCLWFFVSLLWMGYRLNRRMSLQKDPDVALVNAALAGVVACMVIMAFGDWLFPFAYTQTIAGFSYAVYNWLFMGMILFFSWYPRKLDRLAQDNG